MPEGRTGYVETLLSGGAPMRAVDHPDPSKPIAIHFVIDGGVGGIDIYRV
jgi:hypothetical protein